MLAWCAAHQTGSLVAEQAQLAVSDGHAPSWATGTPAQPALHSLA